MSLDTVSTERRKHLRKRLPRLICVELSAANRGMVRDISEDGFGVRAMMPMTAGGSTPFSFLLGESTRIEGEGIVIWVEDKGKVAGVRLTRPSAQMRKDIQNWLNDVADVPETKEEQVANAQNFDQLREESGFQDLPEEEPAEIHEEREWGAACHSIPFAGASHSTAEHDNVEREFEARPAEREEIENTFPSEPASRQVPGPNPSGQLPPLPDISKILMQPPKKASSYGHQTPVLEPLYPFMMVESRRGSSFTGVPRQIMIIILLAAAVAIYAYRQTVGEGLIWLGQQVSGPSTAQSSTPPQERGTPETNSSATNPSAANPASAPPPAPSATQPESKQENSASDNETANETPNPVSSKPANPTTPLPGPSSVNSDTSSEAGSMEYALAQQLLHSGDTSEAVRLLWISVEKGNVGAELTLAELYRHGRGVARNCDQTRILLRAAARKGNADAQRLLQLFQREGCK